MLETTSGWGDVSVPSVTSQRANLQKSGVGLKIVLGSKTDEQRHYLEHFAKRSISKLPNNFPNILRIDVSVNMFILFLLPIRPQLENLP